MNGRTDLRAGEAHKGCISGHPLVLLVEASNSGSGFDQIVSIAIHHNEDRTRQCLWVGAGGIEDGLHLVLYFRGCHTSEILYFSLSAVKVRGGKRNSGTGESRRACANATGRPAMRQVLEYITCSILRCEKASICCRHS